MQNPSYREIELERDLIACRNRVVEMIGEIDRRDEMIGRLQAENEELRQRIFEMEQEVSEGHPS